MAAPGPRVSRAAEPDSKAGHANGSRWRPFRAYIGFVCVYRDAVGRVRLRLLTSRRTLDVEADVCVSDSLEATSDCERIHPSVGVA